MNKENLMQRKKYELTTNHKGRWVITKRDFKKHPITYEVKPCHKLGFCPYGQLVECYPLLDRDEISCRVFGHDCPVYYLREGFTEGEGK